MIKSFADKATEAIYDGIRSKKTSKTLPLELHDRAIELLDQLNVAATVEDMAMPPSNKLEKKKGDLKDFYGVRINDQYRILFKWQDGHPTEVRITDYH